VKPFFVSAVFISLIASVPTLADQSAPNSTEMGSGSSQTIRITRRGTQASRPGSVEYFTGSVRIDPLFEPVGPSRTSAGSVTFAPGARSAWHTHPLGQTLIVTAGAGRVQQWGSPIEEIRPGDVVWIPPGQKHWHGASPTSLLTHVAIQDYADGKNVEWMEQVSDEQYLSKPATSSSINERSNGMTTPSTAARNSFGDIAPALAEYTDVVLFGDVWERPGLSPRDRSLITVASLVALYRTNELPFHLKKALDNGVTKDELIELITHLAFYSGWPTANSALPIARKVFEDARPKQIP
jgi:4-carboxymuconolactone decarboxylase